MNNFNEAVSKVILNLFSLSVHVAPNFVTAINCFFLPLKQKLSSSLNTFFSLLCRTIVWRVEKSKVAIDNALFLLLCFMIASLHQ